MRAWTYNGGLPGPEIRVRQGDLVEVTLVNKDIGDGVTIHWHGLNVPNGEDGVACVTQDFVHDQQPAGHRQFVADRFWMDHCHNLQHASAGMTMHLAYAGVTPPFEIGRLTVNDPE